MRHAIRIFLGGPSRRFIRLFQHDFVVPSALAVDHDEPVGFDVSPKRKMWHFGPSYLKVTALKYDLGRDL